MNRTAQKLTAKENIKGIHESEAENPIVRAPYDITASAPSHRIFLKDFSFSNNMHFISSQSIFGGGGGGGVYAQEATLARGRKQ